jgi:hypothetical protein
MQAPPEIQNQVMRAMKNCSLVFDTSAVTNQLDDLIGLFKSHFSKGVPSELIGNLEGVALDVVFTDSRSTIGADGTIQVFQGLRLGSAFERLRAAVLAGEWDIHGVSSS